MNTQVPMIEEPIAMQKMSSAQVNDPNMVTISVNGAMSPEQEEMIGRNMLPVAAPTPEQLMGVAQEFDAAAQQAEGLSQQFEGQAKQGQAAVSSLKRQQNGLEEQKLGAVKTTAIVAGTAVAADQGMKWVGKNVANADTLVEKALQGAKDGAGQGGFTLNPLKWGSNIVNGAQTADAMKESVSEQVKNAVGEGALTTYVANKGSEVIQNSRAGAAVVDTLSQTADKINVGLNEKDVEGVLKTLAKETKNFGKDGEIAEVLQGVQNGVKELINDTNAFVPDDVDAVKKVFTDAATAVKEVGAVDKKALGDIGENIKKVAESAEKGALKDAAKAQIEQNGKFFGVEYGKIALDLREKFGELPKGGQDAIKVAAVAIPATIALLSVLKHNHDKEKEAAAINPQIDQTEQQVQSWAARAGESKMYAIQSKEASNNIVKFARKGEGSHAEMIAQQNDQRALAPMERT